MVQFRSPLQINRAVVFALVLREMRTRFSQRRMGAFWMVAEPVVHLFMFTVIMGTLRGHGPVQGLPYPVFLLSGIGPFILYRTVAQLIMEGVSANRGLFAYKQITPLDTFIARTLMQVCISSIAYLCIMAIFAWYGYDMSVAYPLEWMAMLSLGLAFSFGFGTLLAITVDVFPDSKSFIRLLFTPLYLLSGVVFPINALPDQWLPYILWNPFLHIIDLIRADVFPYHQIAEGVSTAYVCGATLVTLSAAMGLYRIRRVKLLAIKG